MKLFVGIILGFVLAFSQAYATELKAPPPIAKERNCGDKCYALRHPRPRELKPLPCIPIKFVSNAGTVVLTLKYRDGTKYTDSKPVPAGVNQFCYGAFRFYDLTRIELCDDNFNAWLDERELIGTRMRPQSEGVFMCLKGKDWCSTHKPGNT